MFTIFSFFSMVSYPLSGFSILTAVSQEQPFLVIIILAPLSLSQYLDYIDNIGVRSFVLVSIELLVFLFTFRCMV